MFGTETRWFYKPRATALTPRSTSWQRCWKTPMSDVCLTGIGIGDRAVAGPVVRMGGPVPEPPDTARDGDAEFEAARALDALGEVAAQLRGRATRASNTEV